MELDQMILIKLQNEINYLIVKRDLTHLPKAISLLNKYLKLNDLSEKDIKQLTELSIKYR